jgi:hypothetical protein
MNAYKLREWISADKLYLDSLSSNPSAMKLLEVNQDKIHWDSLSFNPSAMKLLEANQDKIDWRWLSRNPSAMELLEANQHLIDWRMFSRNSAIFAYDYEQLKADRHDLCLNLVETLFHPDRIRKYLETHSDIDEYLD